MVCWFGIKERIPFGNRWFINTWKEIDWLTLFLPIASVFVKRKSLPCFVGDGGGRFLIQNPFRKKIFEKETLKSNQVL